MPGASYMLCHNDAHHGCMHQCNEPMTAKLQQSIKNLLW